MNKVTEHLHKKLDIRRFPGMSAKMAALVEYILRADNRLVSPCIEGACLTIDGYLLVQDAGDLGYNRFIGKFSELTDNWNRLLDCAQLTSDERLLATDMFKAAFCYAN